MDAILQAMPDSESVYSRDLVDDVSRLAGKQISSRRIGQHMTLLEEKGRVVKAGSGAKRPWKKTWRGGAAQPKVLNMISVREVDDPE